MEPPVSRDGVWVSRLDAADYLGVKPLGVAMLMRKGRLKADCPACGRIRFAVDDLVSGRDALRGYLMSFHPDLL